MLVLAVVALATGTGLLADANRRIEEQRDIAQVNSDRAERNFHRALSPVNELTNVSQDKLLNVPGMQPLRRELLEDALTYFQAFANEDSNTVAMQAELADAHFRIGRINMLLGRTNEARTSLTTALATHTD